MPGDAQSNPGVIARQRVLARWRPGNRIAGGILGVFVVLVVTLAFDGETWWFAALDWVRREENAGAVQVFAALGQLVLAGVLATLTWRAIKASRDIANDARRHAEEQMHEQVLAATMPVLMYPSARFPYTDYDCVEIVVTNVGVGPAIIAGVEMSGGDPAFDIEGEIRRAALRPGDDWPVRLRRRRVPDNEYVHGEDAQMRLFEIGTFTIYFEDIHSRKWAVDSIVVVNRGRRNVSLKRQSLTKVGAYKLGGYGFHSGKT